MSDRTSTAMDDNVPIVIVKSEGKVSAKEIITNIRKVPIEEDQIQFGSSDLIGLKYKVVNKYYTVDILFVPYDKSLDTIPQPLQTIVEGVFIYFDAENRNSLDTLKPHMTYLDSNPTGLVMLLCDKLFDEERLGLTFKEVKQSTDLMDIIELGRSSEERDENDAGHHDPVGYDELLQVLQNFIWSNVDLTVAHDQSTNSVGGGMSALLAGIDDDEEDDSDIDLTRLSLNTDANVVAEPTDEDEDEESIEAELAGFDKLLNELMMFKNSAATMTPNERLAYTQIFADAFDDIIGEDSDDDLPAT